MRFPSSCKYLLFLALFSAPLSADYYAELSLARIKVDTPVSNTYPLLADMRLGYSQPEYQVELALMTSLKDDDLNQLSIDVPTVFSAFYHYIPYPASSIKLHLILGVSLVNVETSYPGTSGSDDDFSGLSYGIGFEEAFQSMPRLKLSFDWVQLYHGEHLDLNAASLGVHYDF